MRCDTFRDATQAVSLGCYLELGAHRVVSLELSPRHFEVSLTGRWSLALGGTGAVSLSGGCLGRWGEPEPFP